MAKDPSFDVVSEVNMQEIDDVINVTKKEINTRFDLKDQGIEIEFNRNEKKVTFIASGDFCLRQVKEILFAKIAKKSIDPKVFKITKTETATGNTIREFNEIVTGIDKEIAKNIVKDIKKSFPKVQASIQEDKVRVTDKSKDTLQDVMKFLKGTKYDIPLQFNNYR